MPNQRPGLGATPISPGQLTLPMEPGTPLWIATAVGLAMTKSAAAAIQAAQGPRPLKLDS